MNPRPVTFQEARLAPGRDGGVCAIGTRWFAVALALGLLATLAGWYVTEIGRQPYLVYGLFKTADAVALHPPAMLMGTLLAYLTVYVLLLAAYIGVIKYMAEHSTMPTPAVRPPAPQPQIQTL